MNKRDVVAVLPADLLQAGIPLATLASLEEHISAAIDEVYYVTFHKLQRHNYSFRSRTGSARSLSEIVEAFYPAGEHQPLRIVISPNEVAFDFDPGAAHKNLIFSAISQQLAWKNTNKSYVRANIAAPPNAIPAITFDVLFDISFANSEAIYPVIERFVAKNGIDDLYRRKVDFLAKKGILNSSMYGNIDPKTGYVSFTAVARKNNVLFDIDQLVQASRLWDEFINTNLSVYRAGRDQLTIELTSVATYGGQFSPTLFSSYDLEAGSIVVFRPISRHRRPDSVREGYAKAFGVSNWLPGNPFVMKMGDLGEGKPLCDVAGRMIRTGYARAFRLYFGG